MAELSRDARLSAAFVTMADTLAADYDVVALLDTLVQECAGLTASDAGGLLVGDAAGSLQLIASTNEQAAFVEMIQLRTGEGPCLEAFRTGHGVSVTNMSEEHRWPSFTAAALKEGFLSMHAFPLRLREQPIGAMGLFSVTIRELSPEDLVVTQALADVASIGILHHRALQDSRVVADQLQSALDSRILIEQAKGIIAAQAGVDMHTAFRILRTYARSNNLKLHVVAESVTERTIVLTGKMPTAST